MYQAAAETEEHSLKGGRPSVWLADSLALAGALLAVALVCLALAMGPRRAEFTAERPPPSAGLYMLEQRPGGEGGFRWTASQARLELPNPGGPLRLSLSLAAGAGRSATAHLIAPVGLELPLGPGPRRFQILLMPQPGERVTVALEASPFAPPGEPRELGVQLDAAALRGGGAAPAVVLPALLLLTAALYGALRSAIAPPIAGAAAALVSGALLLGQSGRWEEVQLVPLAALGAMAAPLAAVGWALTRAAIACERAALPGARLPWLVVAPALAAYLGLGLWNHLSVHPRLALDLSIYVEAGRAATAGASPYFTRGLETIVIGESFVYPPASLPLFAALAALDGAWVRGLWLGGTVVLYLFALLSIYAALPDPAPRGAPAALLVLGLGYAPFLETAAIGQINSLLLLGLGLAVYGHGERRFAWAGDIGLAIAILIKLTPAILLLWPLLRRDWARLARVSAALAALCLPALALYGLAPWAEFVGLLPELLRGAPRNPYNQALVGALVARTSAGSPAEAVALWAGRGFSLLLLTSWAGLCWRRRYDEDAAPLVYGVAVLTVASSLIWYHHLTFLSLPLAWLGLAAPASRWARGAALAALGLIQVTRAAEALAGAPAWTAVAGYLVVVLALAGWLLRRPARPIDARRPRYLGRRDGARAAK